jgi:hypothetical protein
MTRMISLDYHFWYHSAYYIVYHRFLPKTYTKLFSIKGCCCCCCCFQCNFPYLIVGIRAWFAGYRVLLLGIVVTHYQAEFQSGKSTTDQLFALRQILEKCNEFNITKHHLFIDFKAAYDTIIRNEVYVGMSELNFPTKLIRLTKATLTTVTCCVKIQND